ncbi:protein kinase domain-containing protein [Aporhodopirellula aestuarii]|uniref:Protein kinase n=1 Tax=Aporhodopirellula aestuarii TaxID=2950107 RepID=A0ABT0UFA8_9BACT|nr:protein kinase [Aporhodopirellula aestuarii]MCM2374948.1 protein kinase [Aporhodopirellula aestuarii]
MSEESIQLDEVIEEFTRQCRDGESPAVENYAERYSQFAGEIRELFPTLLAMEQASPETQGEFDQTSDSNRSSSLIKTFHPEQLGDYRIIREIGRGGMGVVYEAEQESLGRHVALKILPAQLMSDSKQRRRFTREARAAARLHHTNIVPVFGVGEADGISYYAMQFIPGMPLNDVLMALRQRDTGIEAAVPDATRNLDNNDAPLDATAAKLAHSMLSGQFHASQIDESSSGSTVGFDQTIDSSDTTAHRERVDPGTEFANSGSGILSQGDSSVSGSRSKKDYWESVARIGQQAAEALGYAHSQGIIHRDIKPGNLLLDLAGIVWITDFGLAKADEEGDLTKTGDVLGTLRYMPPESLKGKADARSDIFSLGLTLYELAAKRPAYDESGRHSMLQRISEANMTRLQSVDPSIPRDLETIIHKSVAADPKDRYPTADEMAADLERFLNDEPINARRMSSAERFTRWGRRNPGVAGLGAACVLLLAIVSAVSTIAYFRTTSALELAERREQETQIALLAANESAHQAGEAKREAEQSRDEAEQSRDIALENLYLTDIRVAHEDWKAGNIIRMQQLLDAHRPQPGQRDLRGWEWHYLNSLSHSDLHRIGAHKGPVTRVEWSPDGQRIASAGEDGTVKIWDPTTAEQLGMLLNDNTTDENADAVYSISWHPTSQVVATMGVDQKVKVWDVDHGKKLHQIETPGGIIHPHVAWSPDGSKLAATWDRDTVIAWDTETWEVVISMVPESGHNGGSLGWNGIAWEMEGKSVVLMYHFGKLATWDIEFKQQTRSHFVNNKGFNFGPLGFGPLGKRLACSGQNDIWILPVTVSDSEHLTLRGHRSLVTSLDWNHRTDRLCSGSKDGTIRVWNTQDGTEELVLRGHIGPVMDVSWNPDGTRLVSAGDDGTVRIWEFGSQEKRLLNGNTRVAWHPDGTKLATMLAEPRHVVAVDAATGTTTRIYGTVEKGVRSIAWSSNGCFLAAGGRDGILRVWKSDSGEEVLAARSDRGETRSLSWSPDNQHLATGGWDAVMKVWDTKTGEMVWQAIGHEVIIGTVAWSPDGKWIASGAWDGTVKVWDATNRKESFQFMRDDRPPPDTVNLIEKKWAFGSGADFRSVVWSHDSKRLYAGSIRGDISVWDIETRQEVRKYHAHPTAIRSLALSPDGRRLASTGNDLEVNIWDVLSGRELLKLSGIEPEGGVIAWSPNTRALASVRSHLSIRDATSSYLLEDPPEEAALALAEMISKCDNAARIHKIASQIVAQPKMYDALEAIRHDDPVLWAVIGRRHQINGETELAANAFHRAILQLDQRVREQPASVLSLAQRFQMLDDGSLSELTKVDPIRIDNAFQILSEKAIGDNDPKVCFALGELEYYRKRWDEAGKWYFLAIKFGIQDSPLLFRLAKVYARQKRWHEAEALWNRGFEQQPDADQERERRSELVNAAEAWPALAKYYSAELDKLNPARESDGPRARLLHRLLIEDRMVFDELRRLRPGDTLLDVSLAQQFVIEERWNNAVEHYATASVEKVPGELYQYAAALLIAGRLEEYESVVQGLIHRAEDTNEGEIWGYAVRAACLSSMDSLPWERVSDLMQQMSVSDDYDAPWAERFNVMVKMRTGNFDEAEVLLQQMPAKQEPVIMRLIRSLMHALQQDWELARALRSQVQARLEIHRSRVDARKADFWLEFSLLLHETNALLAAADGSAQDAK